MSITQLNLIVRRNRKICYELFGQKEGERVLRSLPIAVLFSGEIAFA